jgi:hypothetical protein
MSRDVMKDPEVGNLSDWIAGNSRIAMEAETMREMLTRASEVLEFKRQILNGETDQMVRHDLTMLQNLEAIIHQMAVYAAINKRFCETLRREAAHRSIPIPPLAKAN